MAGAHCASDDSVEVSLLDLYMVNPPHCLPVYCGFTMHCPLRLMCWGLGPQLVVLETSGVSSSLGHVLGDVMFLAPFCVSFCFLSAMRSTTSSCRHDVLLKSLGPSKHGLKSLLLHVVSVMCLVTVVKHLSNTLFPLFMRTTASDHVEVSPCPVPAMSSTHWLTAVCLIPNLLVLVACVIEFRCFIKHHKLM